jgi:hypothetical protein
MEDNSRAVVMVMVSCLANAFQIHMLLLRFVHLLRVIHVHEERLCSTLFTLTLDHWSQSMHM